MSCIPVAFQSAHKRSVCLRLLLLPAHTPAHPDLGHRLLPDLERYQGLLLNAPLAIGLAALFWTGAYRTPGLFESVLVLILVYSTSLFPRVVHEKEIY